MICDVKLGDALTELRRMPSESAHCAVTSPPYWGLRDYGCDGQIGLEATPDAYIAKVTEVFRELRRVLRNDGTLWLNMGDSYAANPHGFGPSFDPKYPTGRDRSEGRGANRSSQLASGIKPKDLVGMPWMLAFALRADGWYLRQDIIWAKPNPMPESVRDRCTKAHEYIFLLTKREEYFFDAEAIKEPSSLFTHSRGKGVNPKARKEGQHSRMRVDRDPRHVEQQRNQTNGVGWGTRGTVEGQGRKSSRTKQNESFSAAVTDIVTHRNKRSVWEITTSPFPEAHFATFPPKLVTPCILAGTSEIGCCPYCLMPFVRRTVAKPDYSKIPAGWDTTNETNHREKRGNYTELNSKYAAQDKQAAGRKIAENRNRIRSESGDRADCFPTETIGWDPGCNCAALFIQDPIPCTVIDPFAGACTTGLVAQRLGRSFIGVEINPEYRDIAIRRLQRDKEKATA